MFKAPTKIIPNSHTNHQNFAKPGTDVRPIKDFFLYIIKKEHAADPSGIPKRQRPPAFPLQVMGGSIQSLSASPGEKDGEMRCFKLLLVGLKLNGLMVLMSVYYCDVKLKLSKKNNRNNSKGIIYKQSAPQTWDLLKFRRTRVCPKGKKWPELTCHLT